MFVDAVGQSVSRARAATLAFWSCSVVSPPDNYIIRWKRFLAALEVVCWTVSAYKEASVPHNTELRTSERKCGGNSSFCSCISSCCSSWLGSLKPSSGTRPGFSPPSWWIRWHWASRSSKPSWSAVDWDTPGWRRRGTWGNWWKTRVMISSRPVVLL